MVKNITYAPKFQRSFKKLDPAYAERVKKLIEKIVQNPEVGKPMQYDRKGTRELYLKPFRLSYAYDVAVEHLFFLEIYHKDEQ